MLGHRGVFEVSLRYLRGIFEVTQNYVYSKSDFFTFLGHPALPEDENELARHSLHVDKGTLMHSVHGTLYLFLFIGRHLPPQSLKIAWPTSVVETSEDAGHIVVVGA